MKAIILLAVLAVTSCQQSQANKQHETAVSSLPSVVTGTSAARQSNIEGEVRSERTDSCLPFLYPESWIDTVAAHPKIARKLIDDECIWLTIDSLEARIISGSCERCMEVFSAVAMVSDGIIGEAVTSAAGRLYYQSFEPLIEFLSNPKYNSEDLLNSVSWSFYHEMADDEMPEQRRSEIIADIRQKMLDRGRTEAQRRLLKKLEQKVREIEVRRY